MFFIFEYLLFSVLLNNLVTLHETLTYFICFHSSITWPYDPGTSYIWDKWDRIVSCSISETESWRKISLSKKKKLFSAFCVWGAVWWLGMQKWHTKQTKHCMHGPYILSKESVLFFFKFLTHWGSERVFFLTNVSHFYN